MTPAGEKQDQATDPGPSASKPLLLPLMRPASPGRLVKCRWLGPTCASDSGGVGWGPRMRIARNLPGDVDADGLCTTLGGPVGTHSACLMEGSSSPMLREDEA